MTVTIHFVALGRLWYMYNWKYYTDDNSKHKLPRTLINLNTNHMCLFLDSVLQSTVDEPQLIRK